MAQAAQSSFVEAQARRLLLWLSHSERLRRLTRDAGPVRRVTRRFVAGEARADVLAVVAALRRQGLRSTVAFLGEHTRDPQEAHAAADELVGLLHALEAAGLEPNCSLKLSQLGLAIDPMLAKDLLARVVAAAATTGGFVRIDMEESALVEQTLTMWEQVRGGGPAGVVIQAYLRRSAGDVDRLAAAGAAVRLVKGAYAEPAAVALTSRAAIDAAYLALAARLLSPAALAAGGQPAFATHDERMIAGVIAHARAAGATRAQFEFEMLLGVRRPLQRRLVAQGYRTRIYVPYGSHWYPYFMRRLAEHPANVALLVRGSLER